jgi:hypothetical protein
MIMSFRFKSSWVSATAFVVAAYFARRVRQEGALDAAGGETRSP